ncbi:GNAT family N-acetyltransferase [Candidatus Dojkabacteria bacterium]|jgi:predicted acetyltransferase|nr:GNAT family N-acetyltransferase [Candidatus Dojkabacteria bacterium]
MKYIKEILDFNKKNDSIFLSKTEDYGSYEGIIHSDLQKIKNWFLNRKIDYNKYIDNIEIPIAFLNNINVDYDFRGQGYGNELYLDFEEECYDNDVNMILLESDNAEEQNGGFILDNWYESFDFEIIGNESGNSIMMKKLE